MEKRCGWVNLKNERYVRYHDEEWGQPLHDERALFELFLLESFQAGLSWECVLNKRDAFRAAFDGFDAEKIAAYGEEEKAELMQNAAIIRNRRKIDAAVINARAVLDIRREFGSFARYVWSFTDGKTVTEPWTERTTSPLSDRVSRDLKRRGMKFVGSTIVYSFLQAAGVINGHEKGCRCCGK